MVREQSCGILQNATYVKLPANQKAKAIKDLSE